MVFLMKRFKGLILIALGLAIVFPLSTKYILKIAVVVFGFYFIFLGLKMLLLPEKFQKIHHENDE